MPRRPPLPLRVALVLAMAAGAGCQRAPPPPPQVDIYAQPTRDELAKTLKQARDGDRAAQRELGQRYYGGDGLPRDFAQAAQWWLKSAIAGDDQAQVLLATQLFKGEGIAQDRAQALRWWRSAAVAGNADAQATLGWLYANGVGLPRDRVLGYAWSNLAAASGVERARMERDATERSLSAAELAQAQQLSTAWQAQIGAKLPPGAASGRLQKVGEGTMFLVSTAGDAVTAHHVVADCAQLRLRGRGGLATVQHFDAQHDLALLRVPGHIEAAAVVSSDPGAVRQGDPVVVFGYPLNAWLSNGGNLTPGNVSALTGLGNDPNQWQITAPIQPGSSGSPVLDRRGVVVGLVSMRLSDERMREATGTSGQNLNFAVSGLRLNAFLQKNGVDFERGGFWRFPRDNADIADEARTFTAVIECWK
jgi:S1-C subfamily serine protease